MAKAPKSTSEKASKPKSTPEKVEDAVVIEETPAEDKTEESAPETEAESKTSEPESTEDAAPEAENGEAETAAEDAPAEEEKPEADEQSGDDTAEAEAPEEPARPAPPPPPPEPKRRGGAGVFIGLLLGGVAAAAIGFVAARYVVPDGWPFPGVAPEPDPLVAVVEGQGNDLSALADRVAALEADTSATDAIDGLRADISDLSSTVTGRLDELSSRIDDLSARVDAVEKLAPAGSEAAKTAAEAYDRELANLREMFAGELAKLESQQADAAQLQADAAVAAQAAEGRAALTRVTTALDTGQPYDTALADLTNATGVDVPPALSDLADTGVPTLAELQDAFPPAARTALDAAIRAAVDDGSMNRVTAFLRLQLGTRSLEPKEGDDPDAILSRAEAALKTGDIAGAISEVETLPEAAAPAMSDWVALARTRQAALEASAALAQELNAK